MSIRKLIYSTAVLVGAIADATHPAMAAELGYAGFALPPGILINGSAGVPPPGIYMFDQFYTNQTAIVGPGAPNLNGSKTRGSAATVATGFLFVPGWQFLGATYDAVIVQPFGMASIDAPVNLHAAGMAATYIAPVELSWKLGDSGFYVKAGLGFSLPTGTISGPAGLTSGGIPWLVTQPELFVSYMKDGWTLSANLFMEINNRNPITDYRSGNILHADFQATKRIGNWTVGPVGYYIGQITDDSSSSFYGGAINVNRYNVWAAGALVGYDFGPVALNVWATDEFYADASGGTPHFAGGPDSATGGRNTDDAARPCTASNLRDLTSGSGWLAGLEE